MIHEGPYAGHTALIIKQSVPFPFMALPIGIRKMVYEKLLLHDKDAINMTLKQSNRKIAYSTDYRAKNKLAVLSACKEVRKEAAPIVYGQKFHFAGTQVITSFMVQIGKFRKYLRRFESETYNASTARHMFQLLMDAPGFQSLHFAHVSSNEGPKTAIKNIFNDAGRWLLSIDPQDPEKGLDVLTFGPAAFHRREKHDDGINFTVIQWGPGEHQLFQQGLRSRLRRAANAAAHG
jgi:hypothetical protein